MNIIKNLKYLDYTLIILVLILSIIGLILIGSATHIQINNSSLLYSKQKIWIITGFLLLFITSFINYKLIVKLYIYIYILNLFLLVATLFIGEKMSTGVTRQLGFGNFNIQPSEFAKIFMIIFLTKLIEIKKDKINEIKTLSFIFISIFLPIILIQKQPSLSASIIVISVSIIILFLGGLSYKYIFTAFSIIFPIIYLLIIDIMRENHFFVNKILSDYQINRIILLLKPDEKSWLYYQTNQSLHALGSGQILGKGLYNGTISQLDYLPEAHNDFIFAILGEEFGFIGCIVVLILISFIILRCIFIGINTNSYVAKLLCYSISTMFALQTFVHVGVATDILPNTGIALPFISYGGSSIWVNMISIGIVINIYMHKKLNF